MAHSLLAHPKPSAAHPPANSTPVEAEPMHRRILIVDDEELTRQQLKKLLESENYVIVDCTGDGATALKALNEVNYSLVITDLQMPRLGGMQLIEQVQKQRLPVTVVVTTGHGSIDEAVQAMRFGAYDFLTKPLDIQHLRLVVKRALEERSLRDEVVQLREQLQKRYCFQNILSKNPKMYGIFELINNVAQTTATVLVTGETGTGKEQIARAIHQTSTVRTGPLIAVNCAALPENLLESELFGHEKGSFTSAIGQRHGRFELANGGTIFLDEVGDIPASMQAKLLRVLQERRFERVGGSESIEVDVRVIAATNRSLLRLVKEGKFREDLYYRLNVVKIDLPPLRERMEDIPLLAMHFAEKYARPNQPSKDVAPQAMDAAAQLQLARQYPRTGKRHRTRLCHLAGGHHSSGEPTAGGPSAEYSQGALSHRFGTPFAAALAGNDPGRGEAIHSQGAQEKPRQYRAVCPHLRPVAAEHLRQDRRIRHRQGRLQGSLSSIGAVTLLPRRARAGKRPAQAYANLRGLCFVQGRQTILPGVAL